MKMKQMMTKKRSLQLRHDDDDEVENSKDMVKDSQRLKKRRKNMKEDDDSKRNDEGKKKKQNKTLKKKKKANHDEGEEIRSTTRVCLKNLPAHWDATRVRQYVTQFVVKPYSSSKNIEIDGSGNKSAIQSYVTDCRVLVKDSDHHHKKMGMSTDDRKKTKSRRVAFVGFANAVLAEDCIRRLHGSYCQTSKLTAEYALLPKKRNKQPHEDDFNSIAKTDGKKETTTMKYDDISSDGNNEKREDERLSQQKRDFLAVMGVSASSTRGKFWANDEVDDINNNKTNINSNNQMNEGKIMSLEMEKNRYPPSDASDDDDDESTDDADPLHTSTIENLTPAGTATMKKQESDWDFFKSKQVGASDLLKDVEEQEDGFTNNEVDDGDNDGAKSGDLQDKNDLNNHDDEQDEDVAMAPPATSPKTGILDAMNKKSQPHTLRIDKDNQENTDEQDHGNDVLDDLDDQDDFTGIAKNRLFVRNLAFSVTEDELRDHFQQFGQISDCHIPIDDQQRSKGWAFVTFDQPHEAQIARQSLDGTDYCGRLLHVLQARHAPTNTNISSSAEAATTYKQRQARQRQVLAAKGDQTGFMAGWVRGDAVVGHVAQQLGVQKSDVMAVKEGLHAGDAAVRLALGETAVLEENRKYFKEHGLDLDALVTTQNNKKRNKKNMNGDERNSKVIPRSKTSLLVKNLPHDTTLEELNKVFGSIGSGSEQPTQILLPPSRTLAVVEYGHAHFAKRAMTRLSYRRFKSVPLYLEYAPLIASTSSSTNIESRNRAEEQDVPATTQDKEVSEDLIDEATCTLYVKNLNFTTSEEQLSTIFGKHSKVRSIRIPKKVAPVKKTTTSSNGGEATDVANRFLSMGYAFVEVDTQESAKKAIKALQGTLVDGHALEIQPSKNRMAASDSMQTTDSTKRNKGKKAPTKLLVRNVPFQAARKELLQLFGSFGTLKKVRLPKKMDGTHRGFAFCEYLTSNEAASAKRALASTHLYGRHLVIEWATTDDDNSNKT